MNLQFIAIAAAVAFLLGAGTGWKYEHGRFVDFKEKLIAVAAKQEAHVESVTKQQELVNKGIKNEYEGKLAALRNYYGGMQLNSSSRAMSGISATPKGADAETAYPILAGQCAETTLQVNLWQQWATENGLIK
jgi:hypothetical protein